MSEDRGLASAATVFTASNRVAVDAALLRAGAPVANVLEWDGPGSRASRLILGMANWLRHATSDDERARALALDVVESTRTIIGFPLQGGGGIHARAVALACGGVVFDGSAALLADGTLAAGALA